MTICAVPSSRDAGHRRLEWSRSKVMQIGMSMQQPVLARAIERLALAGEQAGISVEDMIQILNAGVRVEALLDLIGQNLQASLKETTGLSPWNR